MPVPSTTYLLNDAITKLSRDRKMTIIATTKMKKKFLINCPFNATYDHLIAKQYALLKLPAAAAVGSGVGWLG